jgi:hypothetical protein
LIEVVEQVNVVVPLLLVMEATVGDPMFTHEQDVVLNT